MSKFAEVLKGLELTDEQVEGITKAMGENKLYIASEENLDVRYGKLKTDHDGVKSEYEKAQALIAELQKGNKGNEDLQAKVTQYEQELAQAREENVKVKTEAAVQLALRDAGAEDIDYLTFKLNDLGEIKLSEDGKVEGLEDKLQELKTKYPTQFANDGEGDKGGKKYDPKKLTDGDDAPTVSKEQFEAMPYKARIELHKDNPELYAELTGKTN